MTNFKNLLLIGAFTLVTPIRAAEMNEELAAAIAASLEAQEQQELERALQASATIAPEELDDQELAKVLADSAFLNKPLIDFEALAIERSLQDDQEPEDDDDQLEAAIAESLKTDADKARSARDRFLARFEARREAKLNAQPLEFIVQSKDATAFDAIVRKAKTALAKADNREQRIRLTIMDALNTSLAAIVGHTHCNAPIAEELLIQDEKQRTEILDFLGKIFNTNLISSLVQIQDATVVLERESVQLLNDYCAKLERIAFITYKDDSIDQKIRDFKVIITSLHAESDSQIADILVPEVQKLITAFEALQSLGLGK